MGDDSKETLSSVIDLRFKLMSKFKLQPDSIVFLRGAQEEMFSKLLQLQLAPNPIEILEWMFDHGVNKTIKSYGFSEEEIKSIASSGTINISKWTSSLNKSITGLSLKLFLVSFLNLYISLLVFSKCSTVHVY